MSYLEAKDKSTRRMLFKESAEELLRTIPFLRKLKFEMSTHGNFSYISYDHKILFDWEILEIKREAIKETVTIISAQCKQAGITNIPTELTILLHELGHYFHSQDNHDEFLMQYYSVGECPSIKQYVEQKSETSANNYAIKFVRRYHKHINKVFDINIRVEKE